VHTVQNAQQRHDFGEFFSDLASKKFELHASLASALKILIPPLLHVNKKKEEEQKRKKKPRTLR
jgi:hypothetical protein